VGEKIAGAYGATRNSQQPKSTPYSQPPKTNHQKRHPQANSQH
jgi:hypothetical protein